MAKIIQLEMQFKEQEPTQGPAPYKQARPTGPCADCHLRWVCDSDYCARNEANSWSYNTRFSNLGEFIQFKKDWGWLK